MELRGPKALRVYREHKVWLARLVCKVPREFRAPKACKEPRVHRDQPDLQAFKVWLAFQALKVYKE